MVRRLRSFVRHCLVEQRKVIVQLSDEQYAFHCPVFQSSIGGHLRHIIDHLDPILRVWKCPNLEPTGLDEIHYDIRSRNTTLERERGEAVNALDRLVLELSEMRTQPLESPIRTFFILEASSSSSSIKHCPEEEDVFQSTIGREVQFAVHHAIHHQAFMKQLVMANFPSILLDPSFGKAPSTINFKYE